MRKSNLKQVAALLVCGAFLFSSCIGSFALHGKLFLTSSMRHPNSFS